MDGIKRIRAPFISLFAAILASILVVGASSVATAQDSELSKSSGDLSTLLNFYKGVSQVIKAPKNQDPKEESAATSPGVEAPNQISGRDLPIPTNAGVIVKIASLELLDEAFKKFLQQTSGDGFSVLASLRLTAYRDALADVNLKVPVAIVVFCQSIPPQIAVVLPVEKKKFSSFATSFAKISKSDKSEINDETKTARLSLTLSSPIRLVIRQVSDNYVALVNQENEKLLDNFSSNKLSNLDSNAREELKSPIVSICATEVGLADLTKPTRPFWFEVQNVIDEIEKSLPALSAVKLDKIRRYAADNFSSFRYDLTLDDYALYGAFQTIVKPNSNAAKQLATYRNAFPLNVEADRFFSVLPDVESSLAGQAELSSFLSKDFPAPFNRVSFVEYCLGLPTDGELAAGSFLFYLEVDDSEAFAKEMIVPRAREVGRYIGSKQVGNAMSQIFGGLSERRLERQNVRRRPVPDRRLADPQRASQVGGSLGSALGGLIGESAGEETAMKEHRLNGFKMYVSDIETYARQTALMKAEREGRYVSDGSSSITNGAFSPVEALVSIIQNDGALQRHILSEANAEANKVDATPLFAKEGYLVILDKNTIVYSLGNLDLLKLAINNYRSTKEPNIRYFAQTPDADAPTAIARLGKFIPDLERANIIGSTRVDVAASMAYYRWLGEYYFPSAPMLFAGELPIDTPKLLVVSSVAPNRNIQRFVLPHKTAKNCVETFCGASLTEILFKPKASTSSDAEDDGEIEFGDE